MPFSLTNDAAQSILENLLASIDAGVGNALIVIYSGTAPATAESALSGNTVLANIALSKPSAVASDKTLTFSGLPKTDASADNSGTAVFFRIHVSADSLTPGVAVLQGSCGTSDADMILASTSIVAGVAFQITTMSITLP
jgi:hypothetical protein